MNHGLLMTPSEGDASARLRRGICLSAVDTMPHFRGASCEQKLAEIAATGYHGVQFYETHGKEPLQMARLHDLIVTQSGRVSVPAEAAPLAERFAGQGAHCATIHLGWGTEDDGTALALLRTVREASERFSIPLYVETHRATILQDPWRAVTFLRELPSLLINADLSHRYTGAEMVYGSFEDKMRFLAPVLPRRLLKRTYGLPRSCSGRRSDSR